MRHFYTLLLLLIAGLSVSAQSVGDYRSAGSGAWNNRNTWQRYNGAGPGWQTPNTMQGTPTSGSGVITIRNGHTVEVTTDVTVDQVVIDAGGTVEINNGDDFNINNGGGTDLLVNGTLDVSGTVASSNNGNAPQVAVNGLVINRNNFSITGTGASLAFNAGSEYRHQRNGGSIPTATWNATSLCNVTGVTNSMPTTSSFTQSFGHFTWNNTNQNAELSFGGNLTTINGNFTVASTGSSNLRLKNFSNGTTTTTVGGDFLLTGGTLYIIGVDDGQTVSLNGNFNMSGGTLGRIGSGTANFVFDRNGAQSFTKTGGTITGVVNFRVDGGSIVDFGTNVLDGTQATFRVDQDGTLITSHNDGINSTGSLGTIQVGGSRSFDALANYEFRGANTGSFGSAAQNVTINRSTGNVALGQSLTVSGRLYLQAGELHTTAASVITIGSTGIATGVPAFTSNSYNASSFVVGPVRVQRANNGSFVFPTGKTGVGLLPIGISNVGVSGGFGSTAVFEAQYNAVAAATVGPIRTSVVHADGCQYWNLRRVSGNGTGAATVTMYWNSVSQCSAIPYILNPMSVGIVRATSSNPADAPNNGWTSTGGMTVMPGSTAATGTIQWAVTGTGGIGTSTMFAISSSNASESPLPVMMDGFVAYLKNGGVQIDWSNLTEKDVILYQVERSSNGRDFTVINEQEPKRNDNAKASYTAFDAEPLAGTNYYRVHVQENAGKFFYSKILRVDINDSKKGFAVYPNPVTGKELKLQLANLKIGPYQVKIVSLAGQVVYQKTVNNYGNATTVSIELPASLQGGVYTMNVSGSDYQQSKNIIVK